jgi:GntR family transcriptional regulator of vanillate catabolism
MQGKLMTVQTSVLMQLREAILRGQFTPGQRMVEQQIAEQFGASRTPVRAAMASLEQEGLLQSSEGQGYTVRRYTAAEVEDAIDLRGYLEGMAARIVAEHGMTRKLENELLECLDAGDALFRHGTLDLDGYLAYTEMNDRYHSAILEACGSSPLQRAVRNNEALPFAAPSAMLPMQSGIEISEEWMRYAHQQHHMLFNAIRNGQGARAQALGMEHVEVPKMNLAVALENREQAELAVPLIKLVGRAL